MPDSTLNKLLVPLMKAPTVRLSHCAICGRKRPLDQHHMVFRSAGELYDANGLAVKKPTITLCGRGNNLYDWSGRYLCHGLAHHKMLHFRYESGCLEYLRTSEPTNYTEALEMEGWKKVRTYERY